MTQAFPPRADALGPGTDSIVYPPLAGIVDVWRCDLARARNDVADLGRSLSDMERSRAGRFGSDELRERYITGRGTLRRVLSRTLGCAPEAVPIVRGVRGRPQLAGDGGPDFNVSHTRDLAVFAIGIGLARNARVGIDIEAQDRSPDIGRLSRKLLTTDERSALHGLPADVARVRFLRTWTCKEAMSKATGDGLRAPFGRISVEPDDPPRVVEGPAPYGDGTWRLHRVPVSPDFIVTVALWSDVSHSAVPSTA